MKLRYFAWVRERIGRTDEDVDPPAEVATVADLLAWLQGRGPEYAYALSEPTAIRVAIDQVHAQRSAPVAGAREVALFPPMTGGCTMAAVTVRVQAADFDVADEIAALAQSNRNIGAVVTFTGLCRDDGGRLSALELEHYPGMAEAEIGRIAAEASARWPLDGLTVIHRHGLIRPGENIVLVVTASAHRQAAFEAANFLMDYLKTSAPFWKREHGAAAGGWVEAKTQDDRAADRWK